MDRIRNIRNAKLRGRDCLADVEISESGLFEKIDQATGSPCSPEDVDAHGNLVLPPFIDSHLHLDLSYSLDLVPPNVSGTLVEAIRHWEQAKRSLTPDNVCERAIRAIRECVQYGTGYIRTHVDVASSAGLRLCEGVLAAREKTCDLIDIQVVTFPQDGIIQDPGAYELMSEAMKMGCDVVGGIPHNERTAEDGRKQLARVFELAEKHNAFIDCHIDETDDPASMNTEYLAAMTIERGWQKRVTASHVCALSSYDEVHAAKVISLLRAAEANVVSNPGVNLHLQGRFDRYPKRRGLTRVSECLEAGINVSIGQDCICDPFYPMGTGNMQEVAMLLLHADHLSTDAQQESVLNAITDSAAVTLGLDEKHYGIQEGRPANCVILGSSTIRDALRLHEKPCMVIRKGFSLL